GGVMLASGYLDVLLQSADGGIQWFQQGQVRFDAAADAGIVDVGQGVGTFGFVLDIVGDGRQIELPACGVDVGVQLGALSYQAQTCAQQVAESASLLGVGIGEGEVSALEESCDGLGVFAVAFGFAAVDGFHAPGMSEHEGDVVVAAGVGEPVPAVHAFA